MNTNAPDNRSGILTRLMAVVCVICPFCIARRAWPDSGYGRWMDRVEQWCPFCRAYTRLYGKEAGR